MTKRILRRKRRLVQTALVSASFALAGCSAIVEKRARLAHNCPPAHILNGAERMRLAPEDTGGTGGMTARLTRLARTCTFTGETRVEARLLLNGTLTRDAAAGGAVKGAVKGAMPLIVALIGPKGQILARERVVVPARLAEKRRQASFTDEKIHIAFTPQAAGRAYRIIAGFALPRAQWEANTAPRALPDRSQIPSRPIILRPQNAAP